MRVIAGSARGRRLATVSGDAVRPTADRVKEALFSMLQSRIELAGATVLDLFAGSGALGIEALSRGAATAVFVEHAASARRALEGNLGRCGLSGRARVTSSPVEPALRDLQRRGARFDVILLDPPYGRGLAARTLEVLGAGAMLCPGGLVVAEHHVDDVLADAYGSLQLTAARRYGKTAVAVFASPEHAGPRAES